MLFFKISRYTENKFKKDGIDVVTSTFVAGVEKNTMHLKDAKTKELRTLDYGMCVWCAGIGPRELTKQLMRDIPGQTNRYINLNHITGVMEFKSYYRCHASVKLSVLATILLILKGRLSYVIKK